MIETVSEGLHRIEVPLPKSPLKILNAYFIRGEKRNLLIDNGFNRPECRDALLSALHDLNPSQVTTDYFITHCHADHAGLTPDLPGVSEGTAKALSSPGEAVLINNTTTGPAYWETLLNRMRPHGMSEKEVLDLRDNHPAALHCPSQAVSYERIGEGDTLTYGDFVLQVISVPGHTPGQLTLYAPKQRFFFSGDHILGTITPNITRWEGFPDALGQYLQSLEKVRRMDIRLTLTGHRAVVEHTTERIDELKEHHRKRLEEVLRILEEGPKDAFQTASRMHWDIHSKSWEAFPTPQKWFASGEALSHLEHLEALGIVERFEEKSVITAGIRIVFQKKAGVELVNRQRRSPEKRR